MVYDVSVIMTLNNEGRIAYRSFRGISWVMSYAKRQGIRVELVVVMDNLQDPLLIDIIDEWRDKIGEGFLALEVNFGSLSLSRNHGIENSHGEFIAILDGDDLFCEDWISKAYKTCSANPNEIAHPEVTYYFPFEKFIRFSNEGPEAVINLIIYNQWTALTMAHRNIFDKIKYVKDVPPYAFQDWLWNCDTASEGYRHIIVPGTIVAVRQKPSGKSLWQNTHSQNKAVRANTHFRKILLRKYDIMVNHTSSDQNSCKRNLWHQIQRSMVDYLYQHNPNLIPILMNIRRALLEKMRSVGRPSRFPTWISSALSKMSEIDPSIKTSRSLEIRRPNKTSRIRDAVTPAMAELVGTDKAKVFIIDRIGKDHITLNALNYMRTQNKTFLITNEKSTHEAIKFFGTNIVHIPLGGSNLFFEERLILLHRLLLETNTLWIHIINSRLAYKMLEKYIKTLHGRKIFTTIIPQSSGIEDFDSTFIEYSDLFDSFSRISTDTEQLKNRLTEVYGSFRPGITKISFPYDPELFKRVYELNSISRKRAAFVESGDKKNLRIMIAGLPDRKKKANQFISSLSRQFTQSNSVEITAWNHKTGNIRNRSFSPFNADICVCYGYFPGIASFFIQILGSGISVLVKQGIRIPELFSDKTVYFFDGSAREAYIKIKKLEKEGALFSKSNSAKEYVVKEFGKEVIASQIKRFYETPEKFDGLK